MDQYQEILTRKLNPRDQAKVLLEYTKAEIRKDRDQHQRLYHKLDNLDSSIGGTVLLDDEFNDAIAGFIAKLDFSSKILIEKILVTCTQMLLTACAEQGELMAFVVEEMKTSLSVFTSMIMNLRTITLALINEKNAFASKALSLAKAVRSVYFHDLELTSLQSTVSYYTLLSDLCIGHNVSIPQVLQKVRSPWHQRVLSSSTQIFLNAGGTSHCSRYTFKEENTSADHPIAGLDQFGNSFELITSVNDMAEYLDTAYTSKIMTQFIADVKATVMSILSENQAKAELEERKKKMALKLAKVP
jgi:hypothetical protein